MEAFLVKIYFFLWKNCTP